jgi:hypothetical protein
MARSFDLSGLGVRFSGLPEPIARGFEGAWLRFEKPDLEHPFLDVRVRIAGDPAPDGIVAAKAMRTRFDPLSARFDMQGGAAHAFDAGRLDVTLAPSGPATQFASLLNLTLAGLAWHLSRAGGAILHAGGILLGERAVVLVGSAGSGKSTWVRLATEAGARSLSDDLVVLQASSGRIEALGTPVRTRDFGSPGPGRWPLGAVLFPRHGNPVSLDPIDPIQAHARLFANLPWVSETMSEPLTRFVDDLLSSVPCALLTFDREPTFIPAVEAFLNRRG